ncbi:MAG: GTPase Era [Candidatus Kapaibacterium sp.]
MHDTDQTSSLPTPLSTFRAGYVAIVGEPNVGKSTLMNRLVGAKLSIVTRKPQTTRKSVLGILSTDDAQIIFIDTPGVLTPRYLLQEKLVGYVADAVRDADLILLMLDVTNPNVERLAGTPLGDIQSLGKPVILLLNKMDTLKEKREALPLISQFSSLGLFKEIIPASALRGENTDDLVQSITGYLPYGEPFYDPDMLSEQPERFFVSELIREQVLEQYRQEIPYAVEVNIVEFKERPEPEKLFINAEIVVERDSQKGIMIGKKGEALKQVGARARKNIEEFLGQGVYLELFVKVRKDWRSDENRLKGFGY